MNFFKVIYSSFVFSKRPIYCVQKIEVKFYFDIEDATATNHLKVTTFAYVRVSTFHRQSNVTDIYEI
jgi:hypothetical protein